MYVVLCTLLNGIKNIFEKKNKCLGFYTSSQILCILGKFDFMWIEFALDYIYLVHCISIYLLYSFYNNTLWSHIQRKNSSTTTTNNNCDKIFYIYNYNIVFALFFMSKIVNLYIPSNFNCEIFIHGFKFVR